MKLSSTAVPLLVSVFFTAALAADECLVGGFALELDGHCTGRAVIEAYTAQVFDAPGARAAACAGVGAEADLTAKLAAAGLTGADALCDRVYATQERVPFADAAKRGTDLHFEQMFFNGRTDWQEEVETVYETEDATHTSVLKEDAAHVRSFYQSIAQGRRVEWPGGLGNFQSSVKDADDLATCTTNAAMCCWPKDRQANDNNGNCAKPYDENCVDKDPADNTDLCFVDSEKGKASTGTNSSSLTVYPGDNGSGEGAIHCHGLAWSNDVNDHTARYKANNLFFVSMYDHMYQRGYVKNIPGAPMCGCVEQMPTVSRSDCTQVDLTEVIQITYDPDAAVPFESKLTRVEVNFNACQGINNRNNDLWAYIARLYYQGDVTPRQFGEAGRIITDNGCDEATSFELSRRGLANGYDHDVSTWTNVAGRDALYLHDSYGHRAFARSLVPRVEDTNTHYGIIFRACATCITTHRKIFYRRKTPVPEGFNLLDNILYRTYDGDGQNVWDEDFSLHSTHEDALGDVNPWKCPDDSFNYRYTFYGRCSPDGTGISTERSRFDYDTDRNDVAYFTNKGEEEGGLEKVPTTAINGRGWARGVALRDVNDGTLYMTGAGIDISGVLDDFNFLADPSSGDRTIVVHAGSLSNPHTHSNSKAGLMFRAGVGVDAPHYLVFLSGNRGVCSRARLNKGEDTQGGHCVNSGATSAWLKVEKRADRYTSFVGAQEGGADGPVEWTTLDSREIPAVAATGWYHAGLAVASKRYYAMEVIFQHYQVDTYYFPSAAPSVSVMPTAVVQSSDIGTVGVPGSAVKFADGSLVVRASGGGITSRSDSFHYVPFAQTGNVVLELLVDSFDYVHKWQQAGIMVRETLDSNAAHYAGFITGDQGISESYRPGTNQKTKNSNDRNRNTKPVWLQVTKMNDQFSMAYKYEVSEEWTPFRGPRTVTFSSDNFYVGIAVASRLDDTLATMEARQFNIIDVPPVSDRARGLRGEE